MERRTDLILLFDFGSPSMIGAREVESEPLRTKEDELPRVGVCSIPCRMSEESWRKPKEEENMRVYTRTTYD